MGNQRTPGLTKRGGIWHIDKRFRGARICESTGTSDFGQAREYLAKRVMELREVRLFGARQERTFRAAATKFLEENQHKRSLERDARALAILDPYIGELPLRRVHHDTLQPYVRCRLGAGLSPATINRDLAVVRRILNLSARLWRDESDRPWLDSAPLIQMQRHPNKREPYPLSIEEQRLLFSELDAHLAAMALFKVNTGLREQEVVNLRWSWEVPVPELDTSVFVVPRSYVKNALDRYVVLNRVAKSVIAGCRGEHPEFVFTCEGRPVTKIYNSG
jgi:integrase